MITKLQLTFVLFFILGIFLELSSSPDNDSIFQKRNDVYREYKVIYGINSDVLFSSENFRTGLKVYSDCYYRGIINHLNNKNFREITGFVWSFVGKWFSILWPHEFGHVLRTNHVGGKFSFVKMQFPGVLGKLEMPQDATLFHHTLALIGGFEANYIIARNIQSDFYRYGELYNDELGIAFGNRIMYSLYTLVFSPQNPNNANTWENEGGDPVNFTKLVWRNANFDIYDSNGDPNKELVRFYRNAAFASILWNILDLNLYKQACAFFGNELNSKTAFRLGGKDNNWFYGTLYNTSVLGAELYFFNYFTLKQRKIETYFKYGFPIKNYGLGFTFPDIVCKNQFKVDLYLDFWTQKFFDEGFSIQTEINYRFFNSFGVLLNFGYKTEGYLSGKPLSQGITGFLGIKYFFVKNKINK